MKPDRATRAAEALLRDLDDRRGFHIECVDDDVRKQWKANWADILRAEYQVAEELARDTLLLAPCGEINNKLRDIARKFLEE